jgi:hypothetical protein
MAAATAHDTSVAHSSSGSAHHHSSRRHHRRVRRLLRRLRPDSWRTAAVYIVFYSIAIYVVWKL